MKNTRKLSNIQLAIIFVDVAFMILAVAFQLAYFNVCRHITFGSIIMILTLGVIVFDVILNKKKDLVSHVLWEVIWIINLVAHLST